jgi:hypothetical protein
MFTFYLLSYIKATNGISQKGVSNKTQPIMVVEVYVLCIVSVSSMKKHYSLAKYRMLLATISGFFVTI